MRAASGRPSSRISPTPEARRSGFCTLQLWRCRMRHYCAGLPARLRTRRNRSSSFGMTRCMATRLFCVAERPGPISLRFRG
jgi:hypothetical protein